MNLGGISALCYVATVMLLGQPGVQKNRFGCVETLLGAMPCLHKIPVLNCVPCTYLATLSPQTRLTKHETSGFRFDFIFSPKLEAPQNVAVVP